MQDVLSPNIFSKISTVAGNRDIKQKFYGCRGRRLNDFIAGLCTFICCVGATVNQGFETFSPNFFKKISDISLKKVFAKKIGDRSALLQFSNPSHLNCTNERRKHKKETEQGVKYFSPSNHTSTQQRQATHKNDMFTPPSSYRLTDATRHNRTELTSRRLAPTCRISSIIFTTAV